MSGRNENICFRVTDQDVIGLRLDKYLSKMLSDYSRAALQKAIQNGRVLINGKAVKSSYKVMEHDEIYFEPEELREPDIIAQNIPIDILYEDQDIIVVNKPKQMVVHPAPGHYSHTLVNAVLYHCGENLSGINGVIRPGIVHRIDMNTTGSLLIDSGALVNSIRPAVITPQRVVISAGNEKVDYAQVHNEGFKGIVPVPAHTRKTKRKDVPVKAHTRKTNIPKREFMGDSEELNEQIHARIEGYIDSLYNE